MELGIVTDLIDAFNKGSSVIEDKDMSHVEGLIKEIITLKTESNLFIHWNKPFSREFLLFLRDNMDEIPKNSKILFNCDVSNSEFFYLVELGFSVKCSGKDVPYNCIIGDDQYLYSDQGVETSKPILLIRRPVRNHHELLLTIFSKAPDFNYKNNIK